VLARLLFLAVAVAVLMTALTACGAVLPEGSSGRTPGPPPRVFAFVSSVGGREIARLERFGTDIDVVAPNWYAIDTASGVLAAPGAGTVQRLLSVAQPRRVKVWPTVNARTGGSRAWESPAARTRIVRSLEAVALGEGATGVTLDMEELRPRQRRAFTALVGAAAQRLHARDRRLAVYVPRPGPGEGAAYDWAALARHADLVLTAGYNEHWSGGAPGPIATTGGFAGVVDRGLALAGASKAVPLLGAFGYRWPAAGRGTMVSSIDADRLRRTRGAKGQADDGSVRFRAGGDTVVYETAAGLRARAAAARAAGATWIGLFSLGREPERFWRGLETARSARRAAASQPPPP
jgi:spore germination protein YaaH